MIEYQINEYTLGVTPHKDWFMLSIKVFLVNGFNEEYYAWIPFDMVSVAPLDKEDAMQYYQDMRHWVFAVSGCTARFKSLYGG